MSDISFYILIFCIYVVLILMSRSLLDLREKIDFLVRYDKYEKLMKFKDDKEFLEFLLDNKDKNNGGNK